MFTNVFGKAVIGAGHRERGAAEVAGAVVGLGLEGTGASDAGLNLADAREIFVELGLIRAADLAGKVGGVALDAVKDALARRLPWLSKRLSNASAGYTSIGNGDAASREEMCEL